AFVEPGTGSADADTFIGLHAGAIAFHHLDVDDQGVARSEFRNCLAGGQLFELLFFQLLNEVHRNLHRRRALAAKAWAARVFVHAVARVPQTWTPVLRKTRSLIHRAVPCGRMPLCRKCWLRGFGARIRQRQRLVTLPGGFLGVFAHLRGPATDRAVSLVSGPPPAPCANPRPARCYPTARLPGSGSPRNPVAGYIAGTPRNPTKS